MQRTNKEHLKQIWLQQLQNAMRKLKQIIKSASNKIRKEKKIKKIETKMYKNWKLKSKRI